MQKTPDYYTSRTALSLMAVATTLPLAVSSVNAQESSLGMSGLAQREMIRRQEAVAKADSLFLEGREAYVKADFQQSVDKFRSALSTLPEAPTLMDRRSSYAQHLSDASVALSQQFRKVGKYEEARSLLEGVLSPEVDPENAQAKLELGYLEDPIRTNPALTYEHTKNVDVVRRGLYMAQGNYDLGKFDAAKREYESVLRIDPHNTAARRGMEKIAATKSDYYRAAYDQTRAELLMQVDQAWELSVPAELPTFENNQTSTAATDGIAYITEKLRRIIIPSVNLDEGTTVEEAIDLLRQRAAELDTLELDPTKKGVNFVIRTSRSSAPAGNSELNEASDEDTALLGSGDLGAAKLSDPIRVRNLPLTELLKIICDSTRLRYKVDNYAVTLVPQTEQGEDLFTRTFRVKPGFASSLNSGASTNGGAEADPFADNSGGAPAGALTARPPIIDLLKQAGILFNEGSAATLGASGTLLVTNTPSELDKVEQLIEAHDTGSPKQVKITTKFVEISQDNNDELGFDWIVEPFALSSQVVTTATGLVPKFSSYGGVVGSGGVRTGSDFVNANSAFSNPAGQVSGIVTSGLRSGDQAFNRNNIDSIINNPNRTAQASSVAPGILGVSGIIDDAKLQVMMRGLAQKKGTDLMTAPSITARSGQKATIEIIREFIYPTEYEPPELPQQVGSTGASVITTSTTTSSAAAPAGFPVTPATPTAFETKNTGVTLEIEPTIAENDFVIELRFLPSIVEFEGFINYGSPINATGADRNGNPTTSTITENRIEMPVFSKRSVDTSLTIYDGYTVAVGGLMREDVQTIDDKVPILGDIPFIGRLFQTKGESSIKSNLIIFVTAQIIDATGRPLRGSDSAEAVAVSTGGAEMDAGLLDIPADLPQ